MSKEILSWLEVEEQQLLLLLLLLLESQTSSGPEINEVIVEFMIGSIKVKGYWFFFSISTASVMPA